MARGQRLAFLGIAAVIAVVAAIVLGTSGGDDEQEATRGQTAPAQTQTAEPTVTLPVETETPTPDPVPLLRPGSEQRIEVDKGDTVRFRVRSDTADHVHVHGYDILRDVAPGKTVTVSFEATITGIFEIELEGAGKLLATLRVDP